MAAFDLLPRELRDFFNFEVAVDICEPGMRMTLADLRRGKRPEQLSAEWLRLAHRDFLESMRQAGHQV